MRRKLVLLLIVLSLIVIFLPNLGILRRCVSSEKIGTMTREEFFRSLSFRYYGTGEFADELELVNRALDVRSPEQIKNTDLIIPDPESISRLNAKRTMQIKTETSQLLAQNQQHQSLIPTLILLFQLQLLLNQMILPVVVVFAIFILMMRFIRSSKGRATLKTGSYPKREKFIRSNDRILVEFDVTKLDDDGESTSPN